MTPWTPCLVLVLAQAPDRATFREPSVEELAAHAQHLELLEAVRRDTPRRNAYLGLGYLRRLEKAENDLGEGQATPALLAGFDYETGLQLLRLGRTREALERLESCHARLQALPDGERPPFAWRVDYDLGLAYLRLGETENCVARHSAQSCLLPIREGGVHPDQTGSRAALACLRRALTDCRSHSGPAPDGVESWENLELCARWLLNLAAMTVGEWPDGVEEQWRIAPEVFAPEAEFPAFAEVAPDLGLNVFDHSGGALLEDFDGDGDLDVLSSSWETGTSPSYFQNQGHGTFTERSEQVGLKGLFGGLNMVPADFDDDGWTDVLVLRGAWLFGERGRIPRSLLQNRGGQRFLDVTRRAGLAETFYPTQAAAFADADLDGDLDLYLASEARADAPFPGQLFQNQGDGTFVDVAEAAGVQNVRYGKGVTWGDMDGDRYPDLYVSNLGSPNRLYRNAGDGTFADVALERGVARPNDSFATWFWDFDNDGCLDLYVTSYPQVETESALRMAPIVRSFLGLEGGAEAPCLYRGDGRGGFQDVTLERNLAHPTLPMGANFGDLDGDGFLDLYLGTGYPGYDGLVPNVLYWNRAGQRFLDVTAAAGVGHLQKGHGVAFGDLDEDGDLDLFEQMGGAYPGDAFGNALYRNPGFGNHWLALDLVGVKSPRSAIGTRIRVDIAEGEATRAVWRHVNTGGSFGANPLRQHIGLGRAEKIERLEVYWPTSDTRQVFSDVPLDARLEIVETGEDFRRVR